MSSASPHVFQSFSSSLIVKGFPTPRSPLGAYAYLSSSRSDSLPIDLVIGVPHSSPSLVVSEISRVMTSSLRATSVTPSFPILVARHDPISARRFSPNKMNYIIHLTPLTMNISFLTPLTFFGLLLLFDYPSTHRPFRPHVP